MRFISLIFLFLALTTTSFAADDTTTANSTATVNAPDTTARNIMKDENSYEVIERRKDNRYKEDRYIKDKDGIFILEEDPNQRYIKMKNGSYKKDESQYDINEEAMVILSGKNCPSLILRTSNALILADRFLCSSLKEGDHIVGNFTSNGYTDIKQGKYRCNILIVEAVLETSKEARKRFNNSCK